MIYPALYPTYQGGSNMIYMYNNFMYYDIKFHPALYPTYQGGSTP